MVYDSVEGVTVESRQNQNSVRRLELSVVESRDLRCCIDISRQQFQAPATSLTKP